MEIYNNATTFNIENVLRQNIVNSEYYTKTCLQLSTWDEIVDEIYETVTHVEPWMSGNARGASTAFCLMYRLLTLKLTVGQIRDLLEHGDSPYIRAIGFLYLRYACDPKHIWSWFGRYADDTSIFEPSPFGKEITMGDFVRDILLEQYFFETIFPRIPKKQMDEIIDQLKGRGLPAAPKGNAGCGGADRRGVEDGTRRPASVKASLSVSFGQRAPNRSGAREAGYARDPGGYSKQESTERESRDRGDDRERNEDRHRRDRHDDRIKRDDRHMGRDRRGRDVDSDRRDDKHRKDRSPRRLSRSRSPVRKEGGRDARDVFRGSAALESRGAADSLKSRYGDASGKLFDDRGGERRDRGRDEVYKLGGSSWR